MRFDTRIIAMIFCVHVGSLGFLALDADGQVVERDVTVTGPRGNSIERKVRTERSNGTIQRDIDIRRPGGTYHRETTIQGPRAAGVMGPRHGPPPGGYGPTVIERDVIIDRRPSMGVGVFGVAPTFGLFLGSPAPPPPPPVYFVPEPIYVNPFQPPVVIVNPPQRFQAGTPSGASTIVVDPVSNGLTQLKSFHWETRRDGALTLGKLGDARAVPALIDRVKNDLDKSVRQGAAWALGQIGDPRAVPALEHCAAMDRREDVREVAAKAYHRIVDAPPAETTVALPATKSHSPAMSGNRSPITRRHAASNTVDDADLNNTPPPPPVPATASTGSGGQPELAAPR